MDIWRILIANTKLPNAKHVPKKLLYFFLVTLSLLICQINTLAPYVIWTSCCCSTAHSSSFQKYFFGVYHPSSLLISTITAGSLVKAGHALADLPRCYQWSARIFGHTVWPNNPFIVSWHVSNVFRDTAAEFHKRWELGHHETRAHVFYIARYLNYRTFLRKT